MIKLLLPEHKTTKSAKKITELTSCELFGRAKLVFFFANGILHSLLTLCHLFFVSCYPLENILPLLLTNFGCLKVIGSFVFVKPSNTDEWLWDKKETQLWSFLAVSANCFKIYFQSFVQGKPSFCFSSHPEQHFSRLIRFSAIFGSGESGYGVGGSSHLIRETTDTGKNRKEAPESAEHCLGD